MGVHMCAMIDKRMLGADMMPSNRDSSEVSMWLGSGYTWIVSTQKAIMIGNLKQALLSRLCTLLVGGFFTTPTYPCEIQYTTPYIYTSVNCNINGK